MELPILSGFFRQLNWSRIGQYTLAFSSVAIIAMPVDARGQTQAGGGPTVITIETAGADPVIGDAGAGDTTVNVTSEGSIIANDEPAILGQGPNWTIDNAGLLKQTGAARATVQLQEGTFHNQAAETAGEGEGETEPGRIFWHSSGDFNLEEDASFSSVFIDSWTANATNSGEVRLRGEHDVLAGGNLHSLNLAAIHLGGANENGANANAQSLLSLTNHGEISAAWEGKVTAGNNSRVRITGLQLDDEARVDNRGLIEGIFQGEWDGAGDAALEVSGISADGKADIVNRANATIRARNDATGGTATGIRLRLPKDESSPGENSDDPPPPALSTVANSGTISAQTNDGGTAIGVSSDGNLTFTNQAAGRIEVGGIELPIPEAVQDNGDNGDHGNDGDDPSPVPTAPFATGAGILVENGDGNITNRGVITVTGEAEKLEGVVLNNGGRVNNHGDIEVINENPAGTAFGITIRRDLSLDEDDPARRAEIDNTGSIKVSEGHLAVNLENGGTLRNAGTIIGNIYLGDSDAIMIITPDHEIQGTVDTGGGRNTLRLGRDGARSGEYDGEFAGFDELHVNASGTVWTLTTPQTYDGVEVSAGFLQTSETLTSDMQIHKDGFFISSGRVEGNITSSGLIGVGEILDEQDEHNRWQRKLVAPDGGAVLLVTGDVTFEPGSVLYLVPGETNLKAEGRVVLQPAVDQADWDGEGDPPAAPVLSFVDADLEWGADFLVVETETDNGIDGVFGDVTTDGTRPFLRPELSYGEKEIRAVVTTDSEALTSAAQSPNQLAIASVLGDMVPSDQLKEGYREFFRGTDFQTFGRNVDSMSGEIIPSGAVASYSLGEGFRRTITNSIQHRPSRMSRGFSPPPGQEPVAAARSSNYGLWTRAAGVRGDLDSSGGGDFDYRANGLLVGADLASTADRRSGLAFGYGDSRVSRGLDRIEGDIYNAAVYTSRSGDLLVYDGLIGYGFHDLKSRRIVLPSNEEVRGSYNAHEFFASIKATMPIDLEGLAIMPFAGLDFSHFRQSSFNETGNWGLNAGSVEMNTMRAFFGARMMIEYVTRRNGLVTPEFRFGSSYAFFDRQATMQASFRQDQAANRFTAKSEEMDRSEVSAGAGIMVKPGRRNGLSIFLDYDFDIQRHHIFSTGFRIEL